MSFDRIAIAIVAVAAGTLIWQCRRFWWVVLVLAIMSAPFMHGWHAARSEVRNENGPQDADRCLRL